MTTDALTMSMQETGEKQASVDALLRRALPLVLTLAHDHDMYWRRRGLCLLVHVMQHTNVERMRRLALDDVIYEVDSHMALNAATNLAIVVSAGYPAMHCLSGRRSC